MSLRVAGKIVPDKAKHAAKGLSLGKCDNDGWYDFTLQHSSRMKRQQTLDHIRIKKRPEIKKDPRKINIRKNERTFCLESQSCNKKQ
jgi:hypothetical protein